jgi:hypothetical protein
MRYILHIILIFFIISCSSRQENFSKIQIKTEFISSNDNAFRYKDVYWDSLKQKTYYIKISIINCDKLPVAFWMMTCAWNENIITNNDCFVIPDWNCDNNRPWIFRIRPKDSLFFKAIINKTDYCRYHNKKDLRVGLILIDTINCKNSFQYRAIIEDKSKYDKIIWSNSLFLN